MNLLVTIVFSKQGTHLPQYSPHHPNSQHPLTLALEFKLAPYHLERLNLFIWVTIRMWLFTKYKVKKWRLIYVLVPLVSLQI
jgi:hypothetical protein